MLKLTAAHMATYGNRDAWDNYRAQLKFKDAKILKTPTRKQ
jgi:hypothetical protein